MSRHTVHSYLRSIECLASLAQGPGHPFVTIKPYYKKKGVMPVLWADDRIPKIGKPSDVATLLAGCSGDRPEDLRDRASSFAIDRTQINPVDDRAETRSRPAPSAGRLDRQRGPLGPIAADYRPG